MFEGDNQAMAFGARARVTSNLSVGGGVAVGFDQGTVGGTVNARIWLVGVSETRAGVPL
jgi:YadA-like membrane anchor domain